MSSPIDVVFYSTSQNMADQSMSVAVEEKNETSDIAEQEHTKEEAKTAEEVKIKEDAVVKKKSKKIDKEKASIQSKKNTKKIDKKTVKQVEVKKSAGTSKISGNNSNIETFQSSKSKATSVGAGSQYSGLFFDTQNFKFSYYSDQIVRKIVSQWRWAESYGKLRAVVYFKISRDGSVSDISIKESSKNSEYDSNVLDAIRRVSHFPKLPEDYSDESVGVFFEFKYRD